jgi:release factor glutamine methyltransferase
VSRAWLVHATRTLDAAGVPSPQVDAVLLAQECSGVPRARLEDLDDPGPRFWQLVERRARREPLQHLVGKAWFRHLEVGVGPGVFVPRPETELVAGAAVDEATRVAAGGRPPVVVDLGAGSGVIGLSVRHEVPVAVVHAVEVDPDAFGWLRGNSEGSGLHLHLADLADCLPELDGEVDVVVSNPPYIPPAAVPRDPEVRDHDPVRALYGSGEDGLGELRAVVARARGLLRPGGLLAVEHADVQQGDVLHLLAGPGDWAGVRAHRDLAGRPRYVTARRAVPV